MLNETSEFYQLPKEIRELGLEKLVSLPQAMNRLWPFLDRCKSNILKRYSLRELNLFQVDPWFYVITNIHDSNTTQVFGRKRSNRFIIDVDKREKVLLRELDKRGIIYIRGEPTGEDIYFKRRIIIIDYLKLS